MTQLKIVEKGLGREDLAIAVLIDFPFQMVAGYAAGRWSRGDKPLRPWMIAFWPRLLFALIATLTVYWFPKPPISAGFFVYLIIMTVLSSFAGSVLVLLECYVRAADTFVRTGRYSLEAFRRSTRGSRTRLWAGHI